MIIAIIILSWLLLSAWLTAWGFAKDLGYSTKDSWLYVVHSLLFKPFNKFIVSPIKSYLRGRKKR
jgi:hypothetical protein